MRDKRDKIYPLDIYERVANRQKLVGADKTTFIVSLFLMANFFLFIILHRVLVIMAGLPMFVLVLVQLAIFIFFGIFIFRYVIFNEEAKMREYSDKNSDSFARFMHLRKDSTHEIQVIMMLAKSGAGKTFSAFQIALSLIALDIHVSAIDIKGREWRKLLKFVDGVEINMDDENPRFVNTMRLDDFGCTRENCEYYFRMAVRATVNLLSIMVNLKPEEGNVTDLETILEQAVLKYFSQNNVDSKNPKTFVNTRRMKYADIIDIISDLATTKSYSEDQRELCSVIRTRCSTYFVTEGRYSKAFKNEITVAEVLRKPLVIYSFNKNADVMLDTMDTLRVFMVQYLDTKKQSIRKEQKLHTAAFYEELQRSNQFGKLVETISHAVTGSRSNNVMIFLLLNAVSVFNNNELNAIKSNITTKIVGKLEDGDIDLLVKEYGCKPIQKQLEKINDKSTNRWQNCFAILYDTGVDVDKAIYRTVVPQYMLEQFKTRDFNENIK